MFAPGRVAFALALALFALVPPRATARPLTVALQRAPTDDERIEGAIVGADIVCLARILRVNRTRSEGPAPPADAELMIEPIQFAKGGLDFNDSLAVSVPAGARATTEALRTLSHTSSDACVLFFYDAGGYWRLTGTRSLAAKPGVPPGALRVASGDWARTMEHLEALVLAVSPRGLAGKADRVVIGTAQATPPPHLRPGVVAFDVTEDLRGGAPGDTLLVRTFGQRLVGRQLLFLGGDPRGADAALYHELPFGTATWRSRFADRDSVPPVTDAEVADIRGQLAPPEAHVTSIRH